MSSNIESTKAGLFAAISDPHRLSMALEKVRRNGGCAGGDGQSTQAFIARGSNGVGLLSGKLRNGSYRPRALRLVDIPKPDGGVRRLAIPSVSDRIVQTAVATALSPLLEPHFSPDSYAYRPGRSVGMAVDRLQALRGRGYGWVVEADIVKAFDNIPHDPVLAALETLLSAHEGGQAVVDLVALWLAHAATTLGSAQRGLPQGSPLSPLLSNLFFDALDDRFSDPDARIVRFADDFVILARSEEDAQTARVHAENFLGAHGLQMASRDTRVVSFDRGFQFLGHLFVRSLVMPAPDEPDVDTTQVMAELAAKEEKAEAQSIAGYDPSLRLLYIVEADRSLSLRGDSFAVSDGAGAVLLTLPHARVDRIEVGPRVQIVDEVYRHALDTKTEIAFVNGRGETRGTLSALSTGHAKLHLAQAALVLDETRRLVLAKLLVDARLRNQRARLTVLNRKRKEGDVDLAIAELGRSIRKLELAADIPALLGHEGRAAAIYWPALGQLCTAHEGAFKRQRPARDALNATINYLTALLARDMRAALQSAGLHIGFGVLHSTADRSEACVWDLMEVFRATLSEGLAVSLFNRKRLRADMFTPLDDGIHIRSEGRRAIIVGYEAQVDRVIRSRHSGKRHSLRRIMREEAAAYARHMVSPDQTPYQPQLQDY